MADNINNGSGPTYSGGLEQNSSNNLRIAKELLEANKAINVDFTGYVKNKERLAGIQRDLNELEDDYSKALNANNGVVSDELKLHRQELDLQKQLFKAQQDAFGQVSKATVLYRSMEAASVALFSGTINNLISYVNEADKAFKSANLHLGLSGESSESLLSSLVQSSGYAAILGVSFQELAQMQTVYSDQIGRAVVLSSENLDNISAIVKGLGIGAEEATKMVAQFDNMGISVGRVKQFYEDAVNSSASFGVNAGKVIQMINTNLERSQGYVFSGGIKGIAKMAEYSAKFKVDMDSVFNAMDKANSLEGAIDMASQLQVLGGQFARQNPFDLLHNARTDAVGFTESMQGLTRGMATYSKTTGQFEVQAGDMNRLKLAADATGMSYKDLITQAKEGAKMDTIMSQLSVTGLDKESKEFIQGISQMQDDGSFKVKIAPGEFKDIRDLSVAQVDALKESNMTLDKRAQSAQTFDEIFVNTINEMKTMLLPILDVVQSMTKMMIEHRELIKGVVYAGTAVMGGIALLNGLKGMYGMAGQVISFFKGGIFKNMLSYVKGGGIDAGESVAQNIGTSTLGGGNSAGNISNMGQAAGQAAKGMLAFGAAVIMVGGGIWLASKGISFMMDSMSKLNNTQAKEITNTVLALGGTFVGLGIGMTLVGVLAGAAAEPILLFGAGIALIGAGIGVAAAGVGYMVSSFSDLTKSLLNAGDPKTAANISSVVTSLSGLYDPTFLAGMSTFDTAFGSISDKLSKAKFGNVLSGGVAFNHIADAIERINEKKLDKLIKLSETLSSMSSIATALSSISTALGNTIEVKFKDDKINMQVNVTAEMDGQKVSSVVSRYIPVTLQRVNSGSTSK